MSYMKGQVRFRSSSSRGIFHRCTLRDYCLASRGLLGVDSVVNEILVPGSRTLPATWIPSTWVVREEILVAIVDRESRVTSQVKINRPRHPLCQRPSHAISSLRKTHHVPSSPSRNMSVVQPTERLLVGRWKGFSDSKQESPTERAADCVTEGHIAPLGAARMVQPLR